jgi:mannose-1-phosphate guanylyltransferase
VLPALVLTAGFGTRLDPITRLRAKAAVPLGRQTLIERILAWLAAQSVTDVVLNLHHLPATITGIVGDGSHLGMRIRYSLELALLGSAGGPRHALPLLDADTFVVVNGDTLCDVPLARMIAAHRSSGADVTMAVAPNPAPDRYNGIALDQDDRVADFVQRGHRAPSWHFVGVQVAEASAFAALPDGVPAESVHGVYRGLIGASRGGLRAHRVTAPFLDVGTPSDYLMAARALAGAGAVDPGARIAPTASVTNSVVWPGASIGAGAVLEACVVTDVDVPPAFTARRAVLVPASVCRPGDSAQVTGDLACFQTVDG